MPENPLTSRRGLLFGAAAVSVGAALTACTSNEPKKQEAAATNVPSAEDKPGTPVTIGFAYPRPTTAGSTPSTRTPRTVRRRTPT